MSEVKITSYFFYFTHLFQCQSKEENTQKKQKKSSSQLSNCLIDNKRKHNPIITISTRYSKRKFR